MKGQAASGGGGETKMAADTKVVKSKPAGAKKKPPAEGTAGESGPPKTKPTLSSEKKVMVILPNYRGYLCVPIVT